MIVKDLQTKSVDDLKKLVDDLKAELFMLRFQNSTGQLQNPHKIGLVKKDIARVFTVLNDKEDTKATKPKAEPKKAAAKPAPKKEEAKKVEAPKAEAKEESKTEGGK